MFRAIRGSGNMLSKSHEQIWNPRFSSLNERRSRTSLDDASGFNTPYNVHAGNEFGENKFHQPSPFRETSMNTNVEPVELIISNLDSTIDVKDLRKVLMGLLKEFVMV